MFAALMATAAFADGPPADAASPAPDFAVPAPTLEEPVTAALRVLPAREGGGTNYEAVIRARISESHHIYATNYPGGTFAPTSVKLDLPPGATARGDWLASAPARAANGGLVYTNSVVFQRLISIASSARAVTLSITGEMRFQACSEDFCLPPATIKLSASLTSPARIKPK
jgi:hypothetical protein